MMNISIGYLNDYPNFIPLIAQWHLKQWHHILSSYTIDRYVQLLSYHYQRGGIPTMFVALNNNTVVGTAAFDDYDMDTHTELSPWLASVYVYEKYRKKGVGKALVRRVIEEAFATKSEKLYLFTSNQVSFYKRFGWITMFREKYYGEEENVMVLNIPPKP